MEINLELLQRLPADEDERFVRGRTVYCCASQSTKRSESQDAAFLST